jgi:SH3-like domain-containing protein
MKKFLTLFLFLALTNSAIAEQVMVSNKEAKIRNGPGKNYTIIWKPRLYTPLDVLAKFSDWYAVRDVEKDVGWVHTGNVSKNRAAIVIDKIIDVREIPNLKARVVYQAPKNYTFKILDDKGEWYKIVDTDGESGFIQKKGVWTGSGGEPKAKSAPKKGKKKAKVQAESD